MRLKRLGRFSYRVYFNKYLEDSCPEETLRHKRQTQMRPHLSHYGFIMTQCFAEFTKIPFQGGIVKKIIHTTSLLSAAVLLSACGGGGGSDGDNMVDNGSDASPNPRVSQAVDKTVSFKINNYGDGEDEITDYIAVFGDKRFTLKDNRVLFDFGFLNPGLSQLPTYIEVKEKKSDELRRDDLQSTAYNQFYSVVLGSKFVNEFTYDPESNQLVKNDHTFNVEVIAGVPTPRVDVPVQGSAVYRGIAFSDNGAALRQGEFAYAVNFADKTGEGYYTLGDDRATLAPGSLADADRVMALREDILLNDAPITLFTGEVFTDGQANKGQYAIGLYGPHAEEAAGAVAPQGDDDWTVGLGGKRGDIQ